MNSPQSPCAFAEPRSALLRLFASSASCWFTLPRFPIRPSSLATPVFESLCACFHLFSEIFDLRFQRTEKRVQFLSGCLRRRSSIFDREFHRPEPETDPTALFSQSQAAPLSRPYSVCSFSSFAFSSATVAAERLGLVGLGGDTGCGARRFPPVNSTGCASRARRPALQMRRYCALADVLRSQ